MKKYLIVMYLIIFLLNLVSFVLDLTVSQVALYKIILDGVCALCWGAVCILYFIEKKGNKCQE